MSACPLAVTAASGKLVVMPAQAEQGHEALPKNAQSSFAAGAELPIQRADPATVHPTQPGAAASLLNQFQHQYLKD